MKRTLLVLGAVSSALVLLPAFASAQCSGGAGAQTGLAAVSCTGVVAWTGQAVASGGTVTYNNCLYKANQAISANSAWAPGSPGVYLYGSGAACPTAGCNYGAQGPCGGTATATPTSTTPPRATATATATATPRTRATATATPRTRATATATATATTAPTATTPPRATATSTATPTGGTTCAVKSRPSSKVLQGYWESWDGSGVHPGLGHIPITDSRIAQHGYNVIMAAFPVILSDGTAEWADGMDVGVDVPTPAEMCQAKAAGATILMSIGGAAAGIDLSSSTVADKFVSTLVPILKANNFDGIDIDIETGLTDSGNPSVLSTSQSNLIRIIDGILAQMPSNFGLTMAPETAYVTGGSVTYGSIWGAYLPIIQKYVNSGRLWWLNMQYYNGNMYGCAGDSYSAATVQGFVVQTQCLNNGLTIQGVRFQVPYDKQAPGLPAQPGAGGGYMTPSLVSQAWGNFGSGSSNSLKGLMTWSINWDGSLGWTFGDNVKSIEGR